MILGKTKVTFKLDIYCYETQVFIIKKGMHCWQEVFLVVNVYKGLSVFKIPCSYTNIESSL